MSPILSQRLCRNASLSAKWHQNCSYCAKCCGFFLLIRTILCFSAKDVLRAAEFSFRRIFLFGEKCGKIAAYAKGGGSTYGLVRSRSRQSGGRHHPSGDRLRLGGLSHDDPAFLLRYDRCDGAGHCRQPAVLHGAVLEVPQAHPMARGAAAYHRVRPCQPAYHALREPP